MTLRALHLQAQENLRRFGGGLGAIFCHRAAQEIGSAVEALNAFLIGV